LNLSRGNPGISDERIRAWGQNLALAAAYSALYEVARYLSFPQWMLTSGLRLAFLLLLPTRFWPALALGEGLPLLENAVFLEPAMGMPWAISESVPMVVLWMALLKPLLQRWAIHDAQGRLHMPVMLGAALGVAIITAGATLLTALAAILNTPTGEWPDPSTAWPGYFLAYTLGSYLGALTLTPTVLALHERFLALGGQPVNVARIWHSALLRDVLAWVLPTLATLTWIAVHTHDVGLQQVARLALIAPVLVLAWRHGWHGTSIGGMAASVALAITAPGSLADPATLRVQAVLALVVSGGLLVGAWASARARTKDVATRAARS
jgi:glucose-6-phosphate-specific signal transduction histidine kinase